MRVAIKSAMKLPKIISLICLATICISTKLSASFNYDPDEIKNKVIDEAIRQNIAPSLALAIAKVESNFNPLAVSHAGAKGVMQIMPRTAERGFGVNSQRLFDPATNIEIGVKFIKKLLERYDDRLDIALSHYNGGSAVNTGYGKLRVIPATQQYVEKVLTTQQEFLQHDAMPKNRQSMFSTQFASSKTPATSNNAASALTEDPQIARLREIRLHNITRNYKNNQENLSAEPINDQAPMQQNSRSQQTARTQIVTAYRQKLNTAPSVKAAIEARIAKVREWEAIYQ